METLLGFTPNDFLAGRFSLQSCIHTDDWDLAERLFDPATTSGRFPIRLRQANGQIRVVRVSYRWQDDVVSVVVQDAKDLFKRYENVPISLNLKAMLENSDDFIFFKNANHIITAASQALAGICYPPHSHWTALIGLTSYDIFPEKYADAFHALEKPVYAGASVAKQVQEYTTKDHNKGWMDNHKYPIHDERGNIIGLFGIARDVTQRIHLENELKRQIQTDFLTGLSSRAYFMELAQRELNRAVRYGTPPAMLMMDVDLFKCINDTYGHQVGDMVLIQLAQVCRQSLRSTDYIGRLGGEEFAMLLPCTSVDKAFIAAQHLREAVANTEVWIEGISTPLRFTVSIGLSALPSQNNSVDKLLNLADAALYEAKHSGRNRVCISSDNVPL
ncbi:MAG: hypothetical protein RIR79_1486 [Pseudomonadota bacterium]